MRIQVVHYQDDYRCFREMHIDQVTHTMGKINHSAPVSHLDMPLCFQRGKKDKQVAGAIRRGTTSARPLTKQPIININ